MRTAFFLAPLLILAPALPAQMTPASTNLTVVGGKNCPVQMTARRWGSSALEAAKSSPLPGRTRLYLHFNSTQESSVVAATLVLHGPAAGAHAELASGAPSGDIAETYPLISSGPRAGKDFQVSPVTLGNVRWLSIAELRTSDGKLWRPSAESYCSITPDGYRLIDSPQD